MRRIIEICGHDYSLDLRERKLMDISNPEHCIFLSSLSHSGDQSGFEGFYHLKRRHFVAIAPDLKEIPADVVFVRVPYDWEDNNCCTDHSGQKTVALIKRLEDTFLPDRIAENIRLAVLPKFILYGTCYIVDIANHCLVECGNPENVLFFKDMIDMGTHYSLSYDPLLKKISQNLDNGSGKNLWLNIPQMKVLDPVRMAKKYGVGLADLKHKSDVMIRIAVAENRNGG